jgi:hypothetical protein
MALRHKIVWKHLVEILEQRIPGFSAGNSNTPSPCFLMRTWSPLKRNSRGSRTAWLRPF